MGNTLTLCQNQDYENLTEAEAVFDGNLQPIKKISWSDSKPSRRQVINIRKPDKMNFKL
jgi:hypothetical protein